MLAEKDLLHSMKAEKELELWRRMKTTMEQSNGNANSQSVLALLSRIKMVVAEEEDPLSKYRLDGNQSNPSQNLVTPSQNFSTSSYQASLLKEVQNPYPPPVDPRVTEVKDAHLGGAGWSMGLYKMDFFFLRNLSYHPTLILEPQISRSSCIGLALCVSIA